MQEEPKAPENYVSATAAAEFLDIKRRLLLALARKGIAGSYPLGTGEFRKTWIFRLSELSSAIERGGVIPKGGNGAMIRSGSPR